MQLLVSLNIGTTLRVSGLGHYSLKRALGNTSIQLFSRDFLFTQGLNNVDDQPANIVDRVFRTVVVAFTTQDLWTSSGGCTVTILFLGAHI